MSPTPTTRPAASRANESNAAERAATPPTTAELLQRYDKPGPRYTSYPTAVEFSESFTEADYRERLSAAEKVRDGWINEIVTFEIDVERRGDEFGT